MANKPLDPANVRVGTRVRYWRTKRRFTLRDFAAAVGLSKSALSRIENGTQPIKPAEVERILAVLDLTVAQFHRPTIKVDSQVEARAA